MFLKKTIPRGTDIILFMAVLLFDSFIFICLPFYLMYVFKSLFIHLS